MGSHPYARTERDLRVVAANFSAGNIAPGTLPARLEHIAASLRFLLEVEKLASDQPADIDGARAAEAEAGRRLFEVLRAAGVSEADLERAAYSPSIAGCKV